MSSTRRQTVHTGHSDVSLVDQPKGSGVSTLTKWMPLACAGAALGLGIIAIKEMRSMKAQVIEIKKNNSPSSDLTQRMEAMDLQIRKISGFLAAQQQSRDGSAGPPKPVDKKPVKRVINDNKSDEEVVEETEETEYVEEEEEEA